MATTEERLTRLETTYEFFGDNMATKADIANLKTDIANLKADIANLKVWLLGTTVTVGAAIVGAIRLFGTGS